MTSKLCNALSGKVIKMAAFCFTHHLAVVENGGLNIAFFTVKLGRVIAALDVLTPKQGKPASGIFSAWVSRVTLNQIGINVFSSV